MVYNFNDTTDVMIIRFPIIRDGGFDFNHDDVQITKQDDFIYEKLSHELKHAYQKAMIFKNTERENIMHQNDMAVYDKAHKYIQSTKLTNDTVSQIIFSVYYLFTQEIIKTNLLL